MKAKNILACIILLFGCAHKDNKKWSTGERKKDIEGDSRERVILNHQGEFYYFVPLYSKKIN